MKEAWRKQVPRKTSVVILLHAKNFQEGRLRDICGSKGECSNFWGYVMQHPALCRHSSSLSNTALQSFIADFRCKRKTLAQVESQRAEQSARFGTVLIRSLLHRIQARCLLPLAFRAYFLCKANTA